MEALLIIVFIGVAIVLYFVRSESHSEKINAYVGSIGGTLIDYETGGLFKGIGPFMVIGKGRIIYRVNYRLGGDKKEGWVRFGGFGGPDWRF